MVAIIGRLGVHPMVRLSLPGRRLIIYLALSRRSAMRALAAAELWPENTDEVARANLRRALWQLPPGWVTAEGDALHLQAETDLAAARSAADRAIGGAPLLLSEIELLSTDILPGWYEEWLIPEQEAFRLLRVQALEAACRTMAKRGEHALATQAGAAALAAEPLRESAAEALIEAHLAQRNRYEALQCFKGLAQRLKTELGVEPDRALVARIAKVCHRLQKNA